MPHKRASKDDDYHHSETKNRHHKKHKKPPTKKDSDKLMDCWTIIPIILSSLLFVLSILLYKKKAGLNHFCSDDVHIENCNPCPSNGRCISGKLYCNGGYKSTGKSCIQDSTVITYANKIGQFIASHIDSTNCNSSHPFSFSDLTQKFGESDLFIEALKNLHLTPYSIQHVGNFYISYDPILDTKCKVIVFVYENKASVFIFFVGILIILSILITIHRKKKLRKEIQEYASDVIEKLRRQTSGGKFRYANEYEPLETNHLYKYWDEIIKIVEMNNSVVVLNKEDGKVWCYEEADDQ